MTAMEKYQEWLTSPVFDQETKRELQEISGQEKEIEDRFFKDLEFGTGGLRGVLGAGSNRMNVYTVRKATQGLADFIKEKDQFNKGVAIAYDSRHCSSLFAREAALCLAANEIKAYLFDALCPTPELSFAVRELGCIAGIVITASHNPPEYNGYKVYWQDGGQITPPLDARIIEKVNAVANYGSPRSMAEEEARKKGLLQLIGREMEDRYIEELLSLSENPDIVRKQGKKLKIVYTPLHGTGNRPVRRILAEMGFSQVFVVPQQELPDGDFKTVSYPNPEDKAAFALALALAEEKDADLVLATDPDADRLGVYAKDSKTGIYQEFTGNMSGMLICEYLLSQKKGKQTLPHNGAVVSTIVTTKMAQAVAEAYGIVNIETLTGFKYIGEQIKLFEKTGDYQYVFGFEESYGCLLGTHARDKDAVAAVMALCEAAAYYREEGKTLWDQMLAIYEKYGYYREGLASITLKGAKGKALIADIIQRLRQSPPQKIGQYQVLKVRDYQSNQMIDLQSQKISETGLPTSNVLYYQLENDAWCCVRPSGTEPKIKFYIGVKGVNFADADKKMETLKKALMELAQ